MRKKKKWNPRLAKSLKNNQGFIIKRLGEEWDYAEKSYKRAELVRKAKVSAVVIAKSLLVLTAIAGVATIAVVAPNTFAAFGGNSGRRRFFNKEEFRNAASYLKKKNFVKMNKSNGQYSMTITEKGADVVFNKTLRELKIKRPSQWDGIWRIVIFDIPDRHKWARDTLRKQLKVMGFCQMQKSVFVSAFPCEEELKFLSSLLNIGGHLRIIMANAISDENDLRKFFNV